MPYEITFELINRIAGVKPKTAEFETATKAWRTAQNLMASDERVTIRGPGGHEIGWQELKLLAERENAD